MKPSLPVRRCLNLLCLLPLVAFAPLHAQGTVPTFVRPSGTGTYTIVGHAPEAGGTTSIPVVLVPITLAFAASGSGPVRLDAAPDVPSVLRSPVFSRFPFGAAGNTQYGDAMLHATFPQAAPQANAWHTVLGKPVVEAVTIDVPAGFGYVLHSEKTGRSIAVADIDYIERALFKQLPRQQGTLVVALTHNTTFYVDGDATICCTWGTHGVDAATGSSFVLASYLHQAPSVVAADDVQPLTQQLAEFFNDPLHDPMAYGWVSHAPGNTFQPWQRVSGESGCGGNGVGTPYFSLEPTETNPKNNFPASTPFVAAAGGQVFHLENVALLPWYTGVAGSSYSFPATHALAAPAQPCAARGRHAAVAAQAPEAMPGATPAPASGARNGHRLIGYWASLGATPPFPLHDVSPQWDIILVAFATPAKGAPEGTMQFVMPPGFDGAGFKADIAKLRSQGKKVMISLGGGGEHFTLDDPQQVGTFVSTVTQIVNDYGFDGVDIDFETPSLAIAPGDTDFRHPRTPGIVNLIAALRQLHDHFGPSFMISLVPEGSQTPAGYPTYGGQFGSYLPIAYALGDMLSFIDTQSYNTPPLEGLDGEIYQPGTVDYHVAMTELLLHGFNAGGDPAHKFPPIPAGKVAVGFLTDNATAPVVDAAMDYLITGKAPAGSTYKLREARGYPQMIGAMFWTIDDDGRLGYVFSNSVGPQLHAYPLR